MMRYCIIIFSLLQNPLCFPAFAEEAKISAKMVNFIGFVDKNKDGVNDLFRDANGDGVNDVTGLAYPHIFGYKDENKDGINDLFIDANGDGINDYDSSFVDKNGDGINDNVIDADRDWRNDITGSIVRKFTVQARRIGRGGFQTRPGSTKETDVFVDREGDGLNDLLNNDTKESLYNFLYRSVGRYFGEKGRSYVVGKKEKKVVAEKSKEPSYERKQVKVTAKKVEKEEKASEEKSSKEKKVSRKSKSK